MIEQEIWKPIEGWQDRYEVSSFGQVRSHDMIFLDRNGVLRTRRGRVLSTTESHGYLFVVLCVAREQQRISVASLVCTAFHGPRPEGKQCAHRDGNRHNNHARNLKWLTVLENAADKQIHGTQVFGTTHGMAKLSDDDIPQIRALFGTGLSQTKIGELFGVTHSVISDIKRRKTWAHVQ